MKPFISRIIGATALAMAATLALAQDAAFDKRVANITILQDKKIQAELKITAAQRTKMNQAAEAHRNRLQTYQKQLEAKAKKDKKDAPPDQAVLKAAFIDLRDRVLATLSAGQVKRLREITIQVAGIAALLDPEVSKFMGIDSKLRSSLQKEFEATGKQVGSIRQAAFEPIQREYRAKQPKDKAEAEKLGKEFQTKMSAANQRIGPQLQNLQGALMRKVQGMLSSKQRDALKKLSGAPFTPA